MGLDWDPRKMMHVYIMLVSIHEINHKRLVGPFCPTMEEGTTSCWEPLGADKPPIELGGL
jgi:hypothetical protein